jgi:hypothetical protein
VPPVDPARFGDIPPGAARTVALVLAAAGARDFGALAATMHPDFVWSLGAPPGAQAALALWQADSSVLAALKQVLEAGCRAGRDEVTCPPAYGTEPGFAGYRAHFEPGPDGEWKMRAFVTGD